MMITNPIGVLALSKREILRFFTVASQTIFPPLISSTLFICIFGLALGKRLDFADTGMSYLSFIIPGLMVMHLISGSYENTSSSLFIARWHNHIQEILLSPLSYFEMVLGLLAGGVVRGLTVCSGVFLVSLIFQPMSIGHPLVMVYFALVISVIFACAGMLGALWAEDFNMLNVWNVYVVTPAVFLGGVFHPTHIIPKAFQVMTKFNPMYYLVSGFRYSLTDFTEVPVLVCAIFSLVLAFGMFLLTVYLFRIGYKLRT